MLPTQWMWLLHPTRMLGTLLLENAEIFSLNQNPSESFTHLLNQGLARLGIAFQWTFRKSGSG